MESFSAASSASPFGFVSTFGCSIDQDQDRLVVGSTADVFTSSNGGAAYVYRRSAGAWAEEAAILAPPADLSFGMSVALEGERIAVGAPATKSVYVFEVVAGAWQQVAMLQGSDVYASTYWRAVDISGGQIFVGDPYHSKVGPSAGAVEIFGITGAMWTSVQQIIPTDIVPKEMFGYSIAAHGNWLFVGAPGDGLYSTWWWPSTPGRVYVYKRVGGVWTQHQILVAPDVQLGAAFGHALSAGANVLAVSAPASDVLTFDDGAVYVFELEGDVWVVKKKQTSALPCAFGFCRFGYSTAISSDRVLVRDDGNGLDGPGLHVIERDGSTGEWKLLAAGTFPEFLFDPKHPGPAIAFDGTTAYTGAVVLPAPYQPELLGLNVASGEPLFGCPKQVSIADGGLQNLVIDPGTSYAGQLYLMLGSASGTVPGITFGPGLLLPLNFDAYWAFTVVHPNSAVLPTSFGVVPPGGKIASSFVLPAAVSASLAGTVLNHAFVLIDGAGKLAFTSNAVSVTLAP